MKIRLYRDPEQNFEWAEGGRFEVELPDAVVKDWRETIAHLHEIEAYFVERAEPQIKIEDARQREELRRIKKIWGLSELTEVSVHYKKDDA